jgi:hypothetical protein
MVEVWERAQEITEEVGNALGDEAREKLESVGPAET